MGNLVHAGISCHHEGRKPFLQYRTSADALNGEISSSFPMLGGAQPELMALKEPYLYCFYSIRL